MVRLGQPPTDRDRAAPGAVQKAASGHLSARFAPTHPTRTQALPTPAPWRLKPQGAGGGGEAVLRRRAAPARRALRAGLGTHRARGARGLGPPSAPLTLETRSRGLQKPFGAREVRTRLSGILTPLHPPSPRRPRFAGLRLCIWRAKSRGRPPRSPGFFGIAARGRRGRAPRGYLLPLAGNHLGGKQARTPALGRANPPPPSQTSPRLGPEGVGGSLFGNPGHKVCAAGGVAPGREPEVTPGALGLRRRQGDSFPSETRTRAYG